ncbi:MAG: hypothetical protein FWE03_02870 [Firmicutes bacterium]|nr:hypothetical protein [Bacillota bacterium]
MKIKNIKKLGLISSSIIGTAMVAVYVFSVIGLNSLIAYNQYALNNGDLNWAGNVSREQKLGILEISRILSFILIGFGLILKIAAFILFKKQKGDKDIAKTLVLIKAIGIVLKLFGIIVLIPVITYLGYTDTSMLVKLIGNILFIFAQGSVIVLGIMFLNRLKKEDNNKEDNLEL